MMLASARVVVLVQTCKVSLSNVQTASIYIYCVWLCFRLPDLKENIHKVMKEIDHVVSYHNIVKMRQGKINLPGSSSCRG